MVKNRKYIIVVCIFTLFLASICCVMHTERKTQKILPGKGTLEEPYIINSQEDFLNFCQDVNKGNTYMDQYVLLNTDIDYSTYHGLLDDGINYFYGVFDGNGHSITNLNIQKEDAGLFLHLYGMVCNLAVESGKIQGDKHAGSITADADGRVLNCINKAEIEGKTINGVAGGLHGHLYNCVSISQDEQSEKKICFSYGNGDDSEEIEQEFNGEQLQADAFLLNQYLDVLSTTHQYYHWCMWEANDNDIYFTSACNDVLKSMSAVVNVNGNDIMLKGYYGKDNKWYIALPAGTPKQKIKLSLEFTNGICRNEIMESEVDEITVSENNKEYCIRKIESENISSVFINTMHGNSLRYLETSKENLLEGVIEVIDEKGQVAYKGRLDKIQGRGHNSWTINKKKGYNIKFDDYVDLLGMGAARNYVLIGGKECNSLLCYKITEDISREAKVQYAPESRFVQMYLDGVYMGMYLLGEKIEISPNRYDIGNVAERTQELLNKDISEYSQCSGEERVWYDIPHNPSDITGGYLMELNCFGYTEEESRFHTTHDMTFTLRGARYASKEQIDYLADYWQDFEDALFSEDGYNKKGRYYTEYIDMESFAKQWTILEMISENSIMCSIFYYKESDFTGDGLIHAGYVWDVEHAFMGRSQQINTSTIQRKQMQNYWGVLYSHDDFAQEVCRQWDKMCVPAVNILLQEKEKSDVDGVASLSYYFNFYKQAAEVNESKWTSCVWQEKIDDIYQFLDKKKAFLNTTLPLYTLGYDYLCVEDGILYGVNYLSDTDEDVKYTVIQQYD